MARRPNYRQKRIERERAQHLKTQEKLQQRQQESERRKQDPEQEQGEPDAPSQEKHDGAPKSH